MNLCKVLLFLSFVALCCILGVQSLNCYSCANESECKNNQKKITCSQSWANATRLYLSYNYNNVNLTQTSTSYNCLSDYIKSNMGTQRFKGCVYATTNACGLSIASYHVNPQRSCSQCSKDYCNPAVRANINAWHIFGAIALVAVTKLTM